MGHKISIRQLAVMFATALIICYTSSLLLADADVGTKPEKRWVKEVEAQFDEISSKYADSSNLRVELSGMGVDFSKPAGLDTANVPPRFGSRVVPKLLAYHHSQAVLKGSLLRLWELTGYCTPIVRWEYGSLSDHVERVVLEYRIWIEKHRTESQEEMLRTTITTTVDAVATDYCTVAIHVLETRVCFDAKYVITDQENDYLRVTPTSQTESHQAFEKWWHQAQDDFSWDGDRRLFRSKTQDTFKYPDFTLVVASDTSDPNSKKR